MSEKKVPSEFFLNAFSEGAGSIRGTCDCCGRTCFTSGDAGYFDEGELEELERKAKEEPGKYTDFGNDGVSFGHVDGRRFIYGCPCEMESLYKYEALFWSHRNQIIKFLVDVTKERKRRADEDHAGATAVEKAVKDALKNEEDFGRQSECREMIERLTKLVNDARWSGSGLEDVLHAIESIRTELRKKSFKEGELHAGP